MQDGFRITCTEWIMRTNVTVIGFHQVKNCRNCRENIYTTFQDDWIAFKMVDHVNHKRLLWANDFPHSDSTWPWSQEMLDEHAASLTDVQAKDILCDNTAELYEINVADLPVGGDSLAATV